MPEPQQPRPGLQLLREAGEEWEEIKLDELHRLFGGGGTVGKASQSLSGATTFAPTPLDQLIASAAPDTFLVLPRFGVGAAFEAALSIEDLPTRHGLVYADLIPDLIQVSGPARCGAEIVEFAVDAAGNTTLLPSSDPRLRLRVIDIKLTAEPNPGYFSEIAYYSMVLAGWVEDHGFSDRFVATADAAVWPGSHGASNIVQYAQGCARNALPTTTKGLIAALEGDLEQVPFEVFAYRVRRILKDDLRYVLSKPWRALEWHVDNRCQGCDYLGYPWISNGQPTSRPDHCMPEAKSMGQLCRVAFMSRGCRTVLHDRGITDVSALAALASSAPHFDAHQSLRVSRTVLPPRAASLLNDIASVPTDAG
jgi:DNA replication ATP-dependent helicase/nuclease Dna2